MLMKYIYIYIVLVSRIKDETGVNIYIPQDGHNNGMIKIEGETSGVEHARKELLEMAEKLVRFQFRHLLCGVCSVYLYA